MYFYIFSVLKMSTPPLNNLMLLGAVLAYLFIPINGMKKCSKETMSFNTSLCKVPFSCVSKMTYFHGYKVVLISFILTGGSFPDDDRFLLVVRCNFYENMENLQNIYKR